jgi:hypothetical protein
MRSNICESSQFSWCISGWCSRRCIIYLITIINLFILVIYNMATNNLWRIYCLAESDYRFVYDTSMPTICPFDSSPLDPAQTQLIEDIFSTNSYINIVTSLADDKALNIVASDPNGGINIDAGFGGITVDTTNAISLDGAAASNFTTSNGNLTLEATAGLVDINAGSGINVGTTSLTNIINVGTSADAKTITLGNLTSTTVVNLNSGTGGLDANSTGRYDFNTSNTASDSFKLFTAGAADLDCAGGFALDTASGGAISLDAVGAASNLSISTTGNAQDLTISVTGATDSSIILYSEGTALDAISLTSASGGIVLSSAGSQAMVLTSNGGLIGIGTWTGGDIQIGTAAVARTVYVGNNTTNTVVNINAGGTAGGINIGNDNNDGGIQIGNAGTGKTIIVGNSNGGGRIFSRFGTGGFVKHQEAHVALADADATLTIGNLLTAIMSGTPTVNRTLTLPTAANAVAGISGVQVGDSISFVIINKSSAADEAQFILAAGTGGSIEGKPEVNTIQNTTPTYYTSGSSIFLLRFTNVSGGTEAYVTYRIS